MIDFKFEEGHNEARITPRRDSARPRLTTARQEQPYSNRELAKKSYPQRGSVLNEDRPDDKNYNPGRRVNKLYDRQANAGAFSVDAGRNKHQLDGAKQARKSKPSTASVVASPLMYSIETIYSIYEGVEVSIVPDSLRCFLYEDVLEEKYEASEDSSYSYSDSEQDSEPERVKENKTRIVVRNKRIVNSPINPGITIPMIKKVAPRLENLSAWTETVGLINDLGETKPIFIDSPKKSQPKNNSRAPAIRQNNNGNPIDPLETAPIEQQPRQSVSDFANNDLFIPSKQKISDNVIRGGNKAPSFLAEHSLGSGNNFADQQERQQTTQIKTEQPAIQAPAIVHTQASNSAVEERVTVGKHNKESGEIIAMEQIKNKKATTVADWVKENITRKGKESALGKSYYVRTQQGKDWIPILEWYKSISDEDELD